MAETQRIMTTAMVRLPWENAEHHVGDLLDQPRGFRAGNHHEQADEEHQGRPFHLFFQHLHDVHLGDGQQQQGADQGRHRHLHVHEAVQGEQQDGEAQE